MPVGAQPGGDHHGLGHDVTVLTYMHVGGVRPDIDERLMIKPPCAQHGDVGVDLVQIRDTVDFDTPSHSPTP